jgi:hypothetical protein
MIAEARIAANDSAFTMPAVSGFDGTDTTKKSAEGLRSGGDGLSYVSKTKQSDGLFRELAMHARG